jgi:PAS domain S-box-containing protein
MDDAEGRFNSGEDALRLILDTTPALIHTGRPGGYLDYFNQRWLEFLGLLLEEVRGWRWTGAVHPEDVAGLLQKWHAALGCFSDYASTTARKRRRHSGPGQLLR